MSAVFSLIMASICFVLAVFIAMFLFSMLVDNILLSIFSKKFCGRLRTKKDVVLEELIEEIKKMPLYYDNRFNEPRNELDYIAGQTSFQEKTIRLLKRRLSLPYRAYKKVVKDSDEIMCL